LWYARSQVQLPPQYQDLVPFGGALIPVVEA
jgi:hypothetical protein